MVLAREKARIVKDYASADRLRAEMATAGLSVVYRDETGREGREAKKCGALTWSTVDGRTGPPALSTAEIESRLRAWLHARDVDQNPSRATDLLADCKARGIGTSASIWFTAQASGPLPSLVREASVGRGPSDEYIRLTTCSRGSSSDSAKLPRPFDAATHLRPSFSGPACVLSSWAKVTAGWRRGGRPTVVLDRGRPTIRRSTTWSCAFERARIHSDFRTGDRIACELRVSGVFIENRTRSGRTYGPFGALRWFTVDGRTGPPAAERIQRSRPLLRVAADRQDNMRLSHELRADWLARGIRVEGRAGMVHRRSH